MNILIAVLVIVVVAWAAFWIIDRMGLRGAPQLIARIVVGVLALIALAKVVGLIDGGFAIPS
ncbi:MAG: hypothetical protein M3M95_06935 [Pseudomonadota bacterium]|nr:hypothetical protein [Pseudomonadota bacterium]